MTRLWFESALLADGWAVGVRVEIVDGVIAALSAQVEPHPQDLRYAIAIPGLCNVHSHGFQRGMAGLSEHKGAIADDDFWSWREVMYRFLDRLDPDDVEAITAQAYVEMLESGYTRVGEFHYLHHAPDGSPYADCAEMAGRIIAAADASGIGLTLLPVFYAHGDFGGMPAKRGQRRFLNDIDGFAALHAAATAQLRPGDGIGIAPHSLRAVTAEELAALLLIDREGPVHIHAAEQQREVAASIAWSGQRPVEWLLEHAHVDDRWCLIHATHMTDAECDALAASGAVAGVCPVTEANLGDGIFPARRYLAAGGRIGTGTDSNIRIGAAEELRALEYSQRLLHQRRNLLADAAASTGARLFAAAVAGGAQALGVKGGIAVGARADIVTLDPDAPALAGREGDRLIDSWIFGAAGAIDTVWSGGRQLVKDGRHIDAAPIAARYRRTMRKLLAA